ncbi:MFS transporter [Pseudomonas lundensis]|uniref:MFS transporter n=1 Tax=Pseudomonas lundensis TaxID=86185 RepID=A0ABX4GM38_9PSED|nr:MFS transporter [Pseudomonas lundensis]NMZ55581.1 multidrug efflux MFS transporter [Pseudomonas lundensis]OZY27536.1 MFS transporter [Pseudomonas lundensis]OZY54790.1 MFS transporter [Pseudomonas lundensis]QOF90280.1 MFS transporter [Pseudomonas lundensis]
MAYRTKIAAVYLLSFALDLVNMFAVSIAYPQIGVDLQASVSQLAWIGNAYMLGLTLIILPSVWLAAVVGEKRLLLISLGVFTAATWGVAQATSIETLIGWRLLQGLGGGLLIPVGQAMVYREFRPHERARLTSVILLVALMVPALSPVLGGWVVEATSWRWVFYANLPLALIALILTQCWVRPVTQSARPAPVRLATLAHLLKSPLLRLAMLTYLCIPGIFIGTQLVSILYVHQLGYGPAQTGALMLPWALASALGIALSRYRFNRWGPKPLLLAGMSAQALGIALLIQLQDGPLWLPMALYALMGFGGSLCSSTAQNTAFIDVPAEHMAPASALWNLNRQLSFLLGPALMMGLFSALSSITSTSHAFALCFAIGAGMTLVPLIPALRLNTPRVLALLAP